MDMKVHDAASAVDKAQELRWRNFEAIERLRGAYRAQQAELTRMRELANSWRSLVRSVDSHLEKQPGVVLGRSKGAAPLPPFERRG